MRCVHSPASMIVRHACWLNEIETPVIDRTASPLQLSRWSYLPRLTKLHLRGVREYDSVLFFALLHAATLTHVTIESDEYALTVSDGRQSLHRRYVFLLFPRRDRVGYLQNVSIQLILCVRSFKTFSSTTYRIFARSTWTLISVISSWIGTSLPFDHLSLIYASQCSVSTIC